MRHQLVINSNCYHGYSIEETIIDLNKNGVKFIELTATKGWTEHVMPTNTLKYLSGIKDLLSQNNIEAVALSGHTNLMDENRAEDFIDNIKLADFFDCKYIVSSIGEAHLEDMATLDEDDTVKKIIKFIPYLEKYGIKLVLEVHGKEHGTGKAIYNIVKKINSNYVKINYDTANALFYSDVDLYTDIEECIEEIAYIHLKDKAGDRKEWNFPAIGDGDVDFKRIFELLEKYNKDIPVSIEIEFTEKGPKDFDEVSNAIRTSIKYLNSLEVIDND